MNRQIGQLIIGQVLLQMHLKHQLHLHRRSKGAGVGVLQTLKEQRDARACVCGLGSARAHKEIAQMRDETGSAHQRPVHRAAKAGPNHLKNLGKDLGHTVGSAHILRSKL